MWSTLTILIATGISGLVGAVGGYFMSGSGADNIKTEGEIKNEIILNEEKSISSVYYYLAIAILGLGEFVILCVGYVIAKKMRAPKNQSRSVTYNPSFNEV